MPESEMMLVPLEAVFDHRSVENLKEAGVNGVIPLEISIEELMTIAKSKGFETDGVDPRLDKPDIGMYWIYPWENALVFYTKNGPNGKSVYLLDQDWTKFKEVYFTQ